MGDSAAARSAPDIRYISFLTASSSVGTYALLNLLARVVAPFDSSHLLAGVNGPGLRWDALHFRGIAIHGYTYEQQVAFQPGWQGVLHLLSSFGEENLLRGAFVLNLICRILANVALYKMTRALFSRRVAVVACTLYAFPPAPAVLVAPYTESPFAALTFWGIYCSLTRRYVAACGLFAIATSLRPTAVLGAAIMAAHILFEPQGTSNKSIITVWLRRLPLAAALCVFITLPFVVFQVYNYNAFCVPQPSRPWCSLRLPLSYSWVQREYWNVGPFRYWTIEQLPNFALAAPVLFFSLLGCITYLRNIPLKLSSLGKRELPVYAYQLVMLLILIFASHTQIALRLSLTDPVLWWTVARLIVVGDNSRPAQSRLPKLATIWIWWCTIWGLISLVLWAGHYPPA